MKRWMYLFRFLAVLVVILGMTVPAAAKGTTTAYQTMFTLWRGSEQGFTGWMLTGAALNDQGSLVLDAATAVPETDPYPAGGYYGGNFYTGGSYLVGEAVSPALTNPFAFVEAIATWNANTPPGSWIETQIRVDVAGRWSKWYNLGVWAEDDSTIRRHSVRLQGDSDGYVSVDTFVVAAKKAQISGYQLKLRLFSLDGAASPEIRSLSLVTANGLPKKITPSTGTAQYWGTLLDVPECSQMVYPDGGNVWCSPTSTSMVLGYWGIDSGPCEQRVRSTVAGVYDWVYDGHGNWPFNPAYAASRGLEGYVNRFTSLAQVEPWVAAGVPVIFSFSWGKGDLTGAPIPSSSGHLAVIVGFDPAGNPIVNDPAAASNEEVQRTYLRSELESLWLSSSGGVVYLIFPPGTAVPGF